MCRMKDISLVEEEMKTREKLARLDVLETNVRLQLCCWHAIEAIRKNLTRAKYHMKLRKDFHDLLWQWIKTRNENDLSTTRNALLIKLREKKRDYVVFYYQRQKRAFVYCYINMYANLKTHSTQREESTYSNTKKYVSKHIFMHQFIRRTKKNSQRLKTKFEKQINKQRKEISMLVIENLIFKAIDFRITHQAIDILMKEWAIMIKWTDEKKIFDDDEDECLMRLYCSLSKQYDLSCKCFLYACYAKNISISTSLIHSRWFFEASISSDRIDEWRMSMSDDDCDDASRSSFIDNRFRSYYEPSWLSIRNEVVRSMYC